MVTEINNIGKLWHACQSLPMSLICVTRVAEAMVDNCCKKLISFKSLEATAGIQLYQAIEGAHLEETLKNKLSEAIDHLLTAEDVSGSGSAQTAVEESSSVGASPSERSILIILMKSTLLSWRWKYRLAHSKLRLKHVHHCLFKWHYPSKFL